MKERVLKNIATLGFVGYLPVAPGTFGTLAAALYFIYFKPSTSVQMFLLAIVIGLGTLAAHQAEKILNKEDCRHIVIDEFAGYAVSVFLLPPTVHYYIAAFFLFRFFDILKPPPIRNIEKVIRGGAGVMADDIAAGVFANLVLQAWMLLK